jgi:hypothetical protein
MDIGQGDVHVMIMSWPMFLMDEMCTRTHRTEAIYSSKRSTPDWWGNLRASMKRPTHICFDTWSIKAKPANVMSIIEAQNCFAKLFPWRLWINNFLMLIVYLNMIFTLLFSQEMAINSYDIVSTLQALGMMKYWKGKHIILKKQVRRSTEAIWGAQFCDICLNRSSPRWPICALCLPNMPNMMFRLIQFLFGSNGYCT